MLRITHIKYDSRENYFYIRFAGEPFYPMVDKLKAFGRRFARFDPDYQWPDGKQKAWYIDADALKSLTDCFYNLRYQMDRAREKYEQPPLWEDDAQQSWHEASEKAQEWAREFEERARKRQEEAERIRREKEQLRQEYARRQEQERARQNYSSYTYTPARVQDALQVLGLSNSVTKDELKQTHRKLMLLHHPDKHMLAAPDVRHSHEEQSKKINAAHDIVLHWLIVRV